MSDTLVGHEVGKYRLERCIGRGGMGEVYLGCHREIGSQVAIKVLAAEWTRSREAVQRFFNEARAANSVRHESIVKVLDLDVLPDGRPYSVMEYLDGWSLGKLLRQGAVPLDPLCRVVEQVLSAIHAAHEQRIVHRDLKPDNIYVTRAGQVKVLDFGIAKLAADEQAPVTQLGQMVGTPQYMAPEQVAGDAVDARTDVYAAGVILFEGATGERPFTGDTPYELYRRIMDAAPPWPHKLRPETQGPLEAIILRALNKEPAQRFPSARAMQSALRRAREGLERATLFVADGSLLAVQEPWFDPSANEPDEALAAPAVTSPGGAGKPAVTVPLQPAPAVAPAAVEGGKPALAQVPAHERNPWRMAVVLLLVGLASLSTVAGLLMQSSTRVTPGEALPAPVPTPQDPSRPAPEESGGLQRLPGIRIIQTGRTAKRLPASYDVRRFDALGYFATAQKLAREVMEDAVLVDLDVDGVFPAGHADLTLQDDYRAEYRFRSPSRSLRDPGLPRNVEQDIRCIVVVEASVEGVEVYTTVSNDCEEKPSPAWKCSLAEAWKLAREQALKEEDAIPEGNVVASVSWLQDGWYFDFGETSTSVADGCR